MKPTGSNCGSVDLTWRTAFIFPRRKTMSNIKKVVIALSKLLREEKKVTNPETLEQLLYRQEKLEKAAEKEHVHPRHLPRPEEIEDLG